MSRRKALLALSLFGIGTAAAGKLLQSHPGLLKLLAEGKEDTFNFLKRLRNTLDSDSFDDATNKPTREEIDAYKDYLSGISLRYISPTEIVSAHLRKRNGVYNQIPDAAVWSRIEPTLKVTDEIRAELGVPLRYIASAYRSPSYNAECPGAVKQSYHTKNMALDLVYDTAPSEAAKVAKFLRGKGFFKGGIGSYSSFIHVDTRGRNATWGA